MNTPYPTSYTPIRPNRVPSNMYALNDDADSRYLAGFFVKSSDGKRLYKITFDAATRFWTCSCTAGIMRGECKHLKAHDLIGRGPGESVSGAEKARALARQRELEAEQTRKEADAQIAAAKRRQEAAEQRLRDEREQNRVQQALDRALAQQAKKEAESLLSRAIAEAEKLASRKLGRPLSAREIALIRESTMQRVSQQEPVARGGLRLVRGDEEEARRTAAPVRRRFAREDEEV